MRIKSGKLYNYRNYMEQNILYFYSTTIQHFPQLFCGDFSCNSFTGCRGVPGRTTLPGARSSALYRLARLCDVTGVSRGGDTGRRYVKRGEGNAVFNR